MITDSGNRTEFNSGAVRDMQEDKGWFCVMPLDVVSELMGGDYILTQIAQFVETREEVYLYNILENYAHIGFKNELDMLLEVSIHFKNGAEKYGVYNWQKGIPINSYIDSMTRHYLKWKYKQNDERHDRAFVWNVLCCLWTLKHKGNINE